MELQSKQLSTKGPAGMFSGDVYFDVIAKGEEPSRMRVNTVRFAPCARTASHAHAVGGDAPRHRGRRAGPVPRPLEGIHALADAIGATIVTLEDTGHGIPLNPVWATVTAQIDPWLRATTAQ